MSEPTELVSPDKQMSELNQSMCVDQVMRKREYNKRYYQTVTKTKRERRKKNTSNIERRQKELERENAALRESLNMSKKRNRQLLSTYQSELLAWD